MPDCDENSEWENVRASAAMALQAGDSEGAIIRYSEFLGRNPMYAEAYYKRAVALSGIGRLHLALADYDRALAINPKHGFAWCNRGHVLERLGHPEEALDCYDRASSINPDDFLAPYNRGSVLRKLGRLQDALFSYEKAIDLKTDFSEAFVNRGNLLQQMERHDEAVASYTRAIEIKPICAAAFQGLGTSLSRLKRFEDAVKAFEEVLRLNPEQNYILGERRHAQMQVCDWAGLSRDLDLIAEGLRARKAVCPPHAILALVDSGPLQRLAAEVWMERECPPDDSLGAIPRRSSPQRIRIGYFSADFRNHAVSLLTAELFEIHDRAKFEIVAFAFGPESDDPVRARLKRTFDQFLDVRMYSDSEIATLSRRLEIDIAVDLGGFTEHCRTRIFAQRAAPIQISYIGYLGTMGAPYMDYLVADAAIIPDAERCNYTEKIAYLPSYQANDSSMRMSSRVFTRDELGLPAQGFVYSCFNSNYKITPETFRIWMSILRRVENSCMFIYSESASVDRNLRKEARKLGVNPQRIIFGRRMAREDYLARFRAVDLFLDTYPYNAGTTASDALWAGLPVLTYSGRSFASRVAASLLVAIDVPELITSSTRHYEELAVQLAQQPESLAAIRSKLQANRSRTPLFNTRSFTQNLESAYITMMKRLEAGLPPHDIHVNS